MTAPASPPLAEGTWVWIGGGRVPTGKGFDVRNPYTGELVGRAGQAGDAHITAALDGSAVAGVRDALPPHERALLLERVADRYEAEANQAALLITSEAGICLKGARHEVRRAVCTLRVAADQARRLVSTDWAAPYRFPGRDGRAELRVVPEPVRLAIAITPFNHPLNQVVHKVAPAVAAGAPIVLKPSEKTPLSALRLARVLTEEGLPRHQFNVITGRPPGPLVQALVCDPRVELVTFTGSVNVGRSIARTAAAGGNELVRYVPELGGNAAFVVLEDADVDRAAHVALAAFDNAGQRCTSINRILVQGSIADHFVARLSELAGGLRWGDPFDAETDVGPVIDDAAARRIEAAIVDATRGGAKLLVGGGRHGAVVEPTVLDRVAFDMDVVRQELFGPVAPVMRVDTLEECIRIVRSDDRRLAGAIATASEDVALAYATAVRVGQLSWNGPPGYRTEAAPFGGFGASGNGEKEGVVHATRAMINLRTFYRH